jgi:triacylglycerol esterase/lipase EstA (alpha/beta hydrolase family)
MPQQSPSTPSLGAVVLLHGHGRTGLSMAPLAMALEGAGYATLAPSYGLRRTMPQIIDYLQPRVRAFAAAHDGPLHVVTHSLGGLVARAWLAQVRPARLGRVVMLAPPNGGSPLADLLHRYGLAGAVLGPVGEFLRTRRTRGAQAQLGAVNYDLGIIAGDHMLLPALTRRFIPGDGDGKVAVAATHVAGMADHIVLPVAHMLMPRDPRVIAQVAAYLATGAFSR